MADYKQKYEELGREPDPQPDPYYKVATIHCDMTHSQLFQHRELTTKLHWYHLLNEVFLLANGSTVACWALREQPGPDQLEIHIVIAQKATEWLERYGCQKCPGWYIKDSGY